MLAALALTAVLLQPIEPPRPLRDLGYGINQVELKVWQEPYEGYCGIHSDKEECMDIALEIAL